MPNMSQQGMKLYWVYYVNKIGEHVRVQAMASSANRAEELAKKEPDVYDILWVETA
jgi:hypothetical protein